MNELQALHWLVTQVGIKIYITSSDLVTVYFEGAGHDNHLTGNGFLDAMIKSREILEPEFKNGEVAQRESASEELRSG